MPGFAAAIFTSAFLLFWVQPLFSKMILPLLGGTPSVWNTAMMFFQLVLLAGYGYAHLLTRHVARLGWQIAIHGAVVAAGLTFLPFALAPGLTPPTGGSPVFWLIGRLTLSVGWPFFALSASAPLLQAWFARSGHRAGKDPYFLYAASNAGSLLALLAFPVLLEPELSLAGQAHAWRAGYCALLLMLAVLAVLLIRAGSPSLAAVERSKISWRQRLTWMALAFVPSSLLLGVTTHITTDIAAAPLFWVLPFALYLLTFIIAFAWRGSQGRHWILVAQAAGIVGVLATTVLTMAYGLGGSVGAMLGVHVFAFFTTALMCHCELARRRPAASGLTSFYVCLSIGGALGGIFNALIAPALFSTGLEYYLVLIAACILRGLTAGDSRQFVWWDAFLPLLLGLFVTAVVYYATQGPTPVILTRFLFLLVCSLTLYWFSQRSNRFALGVAAMLAGILLLENTVDIMHTQRSFFGITKIRRMEDKGLIGLMHGTTLHGAEFIDRSRRDEPLTYYARSGPLGQALAHAGPRRRAALVGLGTGALACYRKPGDDWTFFEIDGAMEKIARDTRFFHYLEDCKGVKVRLGDGRLLLQAAPDRSYDLIVMDAFSSDAIPTHLLTREALALYLRKLRPGGIVLFHLSNKYLRLGPVLSDGVASIGAFARHQYYLPSDAEAERGAAASEWMVIAAAKSDLDFLGDDKRWETVRAAPDAAPWTDDFSNIFRVIVW